jgi:FAD/FMN-containing dehydrogenase
MAAAQLGVLGGAVARVPAEATAFAHRGRRVIANVAAMYQRPDEREVHEAWARDFAAGLAPQGTGAYVAFLGDEGEARVHEAYPGSTWQRLATIKARYDPDNLFRLNQNVPPAPDDAR